MSKNKDIGERSISPNQKKFFVFCKKDVITNKVFFQKMYRVHVFRLGYVVLPPPKLDQKRKNLMMSSFFYSSLDPVWLISYHETWSAGRNYLMESAGI